VDDKEMPVWRACMIRQLVMARDGMYSCPWMSLAGISAITS